MESVVGLDMYNLVVGDVKIMGEKEEVSLAAFSHTQWGNTHKGGG